MNRMDHSTDTNAASPQRQEEDVRAEAPREEDRELSEDDNRPDFESGDPGEFESQSPLFNRNGFQEAVGEQAEFRERFDEDLYTDREDRPAQGNTADVAMGEQRFGSEAEAYTEYAYRRAGDHHQGDESAVGQARDPADIADDDEPA